MNSWHAVHPMNTSTVCKPCGSLPGMRDSVIEGMREDLEDCATELDW